MTNGCAEDDKSPSSKRDDKGSFPTKRSLLLSGCQATIEGGLPGLLSWSVRALFDGDAGRHKRGQRGPSTSQSLWQRRHLPHHAECGTIQSGPIRSPSVICSTDHEPRTVNLYPVSPRKISRRTYALVSLGCPKNLVDSERMAGLLQLDGYRMLPEPDGAEVVVINTCGFIGDARDESHETIQEILQLKKRGRAGRVIVTGCLVERDKERLLERYPQIDQLLGVFARDEIAIAVGRLDRGENEHQSIFRPAPVGLCPIRAAAGSRFATWHF